MRRLANWESRLDSYVTARRALPFAWGRNDCVLYAAGAIEAMTGEALALPKWTTGRQALRHLQSLGGLELAVDYVLTRLPGPRHAKRGDILLIPQTRPLLAVCLGRLAAAPGAARSEFVVSLTAVTAWKVG